MKTKENKKSKLGFVIVIVIVILLLLVVCFALKSKDHSSNSGKNASQGEVADENVFDGVLITAVDKKGKPIQNDFMIDGLILVGNRHSYDGLEEGSEEVIAKLAKNGYQTENIQSSFYLNEYIQFYVSASYEGDENDVRILVVPHHDIEKLQKMSHSDLEVLASEKGFVMNYVTPDPDNYFYVNEGYVSLDYPEGKYDVLFTYQNKIAYYIVINETKEPTEE